MKGYKVIAEERMQILFESALSGMQEFKATYMDRWELMMLNVRRRKTAWIRNGTPQESKWCIIRNAVQGLEKLGYLSKVEKKGRTISDKGMKKLDGMATEILQELVAKDKSLKIYT